MALWLHHRCFMATTLGGSYQQRSIPTAIITQLTNSDFTAIFSKSIGEREKVFCDLSAHP